ncbi:SIS domain-containing protein [Cellulomonas sp. NTE-D12]|uniref:SIS domain-containing protein n=1 Tax=Cellulomonas sp. NTE-D12 TaxID=2962632 RepID=UPI0030817384|nr:glucosamine-6-phosphate deaminase [Cellulomonas sp. NTE-D12]
MDRTPSAPSGTADPAPSTGPGALMRAEIAEQPGRWSDLLTTGRDALDQASALLRAARPELIVLAARGSSDHAAQYAQYLVHHRLGIPAMLATPSSISQDAGHLTYPRAVMVAVSQSGQSPDLLATVEDARAGGVPVIAVSNDASSALAGLADVHVDIGAGPERSVAATKTYTGEVLALRQLVMGASRGPELDVDGLVASASAVLAAMDEQAVAAAAALDRADRVLVVGRGLSMGSAKEGALKLMETCALAASGWSAADATHGPLGQVVEGTTVLALTAGARSRDSVLQLARAAAAQGGRVVTVLDDARLEGVADGWARGVVPRPADDLAPLLEILPIQRVALELALRRGLDPDHPRGLRKVTLTR